jgi:hypothetical protein
VIEAIMKAVILTFGAWLFYYCYTRRKTASPTPEPAVSTAPIVQPTTKTNIGYDRAQRHAATRRVYIPIRRRTE